MSNVNKVFFLLLGILLLAFLLRIIGLSQLPSGFHVDELQAGYQGYKILLTGRDVFGNVLPFYLNRIGDFRPAGILYLAGISELLFGMHIWAVRLPSAFIGSLTIFPLYFLTLQISKKKSIALLSSLLLAISPWDIVASRATSESLIALFLTIVGFVLLINGLEKKKNGYFLSACLSLLASYFFYHNPRAFIPVILVLMLGILYLMTKKLSRPFIVMVAIICLVTVGLSFTQFGIGRFNQTSIFNNKDIQTHIKVLNDSEHGHILMARIFDNKIVVYTKTFIDQYLSYFSTQYLFSNGGLPDRYVVPNMGLLYYIELPFILLGCYFVMKHKQPYFFIPLLWLLVGPLSAAITLEDSPNIQRSIFMLPSFQIFEAYGLYFSLNLLRPWIKNIAISVISLAFVANIVYFLHAYIVQSPAHIPFLRQGGTQELFMRLDQLESHYDKIYVTFGEDMPLYYLFFNAPRPLLQEPFLTYTTQPITIGKYTFVHADCPSRVVQPIKEKILVVDNGNCSPALHVVQNIMRNDDTTAYIVESN